MQIEITCRDTGIGISPQKMQHLFDSFRLGDENLSRKFGGTGLGLSISRRLAEMMGGSIWVESEGVQGYTKRFKFLYSSHPLYNDFTGTQI